MVRSDTNPLYPINFLRNAALSLATTHLVLPLDVDCIPRGINGVSLPRRLVEQIRDTKAIFILPAFEAMDPGVVKRALTKAVVATEWRRGKLQQFAVKIWLQGHAGTDYEHWLESKVMYPVAYADGYEPYFIASRLLLPQWDSRFQGYGLNKASCFCSEQWR